MTPNPRVPGGKNAFSLVELLVALVIVGVFSVILYDMLIGGIKAFRSEEGKTASMEYAVLAYERIACDVRRAMYYWIPDDIDVPPMGVRNGIVLGMDCFSRIDYPTDNSLPLCCHGPVLYALVKEGDNDFYYLARGNRVLRAIKLSALKFDLIDSERSDGTKQGFLSVRITGYGGREHDEYTLVALLSLNSYNLRKIHPFWVENHDLFTGEQH